jgi:hypothetical protein
MWLGSIVVLLFEFCPANTMPPQPINTNMKIAIILFIKSVPPIENSKASLSTPNAKPSQSPIFSELVKQTVSLRSGIAFTATKSWRN